MRAITAGRFGEPREVLRLGDRDPPRIGPDDVLVRVTARPVNPSDLLTIRGAYAGWTRLPLTPGFEGVGTVIATGRSVAGLGVGDRVLPLDGTGTWAEHVVAPAHRCIAVPAAIDDDGAAQLYVNPMSAWLMLTEVLALPRGAVIAANAAASAAGRLLAGLSRRFGLRLIAVVRSPRFAERLLAAGADRVVAAEPAGLPAAIAGCTGGAGLDAALDAVGGAAGTALAACVAAGGTFVNYGLLSGQPLTLDGGDMVRRRITVRAFWLREWLKTATPERRQAAFAAVIDLAAAGGLSLPVAARFDLSDIAAAAAEAERPGRWGKVLLVG